MIRREWRRWQRGESLMTDPTTGEDTWMRVILVSVTLAAIAIGSVVAAVWLASLFL